MIKNTHLPPPPSTTISGTSGTASGKSKLILYDVGGADGNKNGLDVAIVAIKAL